MSDFLVKRDDLRECRVAESEAPALEPGQALLRVDSFGMTANNVTYAVMGEAMSYWDFFPAEDGWGRVPMWGFAEVERSEAERGRGGDAAVRLPAAVLAPGGDAGRASTAAASSTARRTGRRCPRPTTATWRRDGDPFYRADTEDMQMLLRPLFFTSFLIDDQLADEGLTGRGPIVISSASSKTAIAAAFLLAQRQGVELIGLTSPRSAEFVAGLGIYGRTVTYDAIDSLERGPRHLRRLRRRRRRAPGGPLPLRRGAGPQHGRRGHPLGGLRGRRRASCRGRRRPSSSPPTGSSSAPRTGDAPAWSSGSPTPGTPSASGPAAGSRSSTARDSRAVRSAYLDVLEGRVDPETAHVISLR